MCININRRFISVYQQKPCLKDIQKIIATMKEALPCLTQLVVGLLPPRPGFDAISCWIYGGQIEPPTGFVSEYFIFSVSFPQLST